MAVAGPISDKDDALNVEDQSALSPEAGDKFGTAEWKTFKTPTAYLNFNEAFQRKTRDAGVAAYGAFE